MKVKVFKPGTAPNRALVVALWLEEGTELYFLDGEPVAFLHRGTLHVSASVHFENQLLPSMPGLATYAGRLQTVSEKDVTRALLFRDRVSNILLHRAFGSMPFGGIANFDFSEGAMNFEQIAGNVERLRKALEDHAERDKKDTAERVRLGQAVAGFGALLKLAAEYSPTPETEEF